MRNPLLIDAYTGLGMALAAQQRYEEAIRQFRAAVVLAPHEAYVHNNLGYAYLLNGAHADAVKVFEEAIRLDPEHGKSRENLSVAQARSELPVAQLAAQPSADASLVEVAPQVFELKAPVRHPRIEAVPLPLQPEAQPRAASSRYFGLEVSNGNGVSGLAGRVAARLANAGVRTGWLTNQPPFQQAKTEVHYRPSYAAEAAELVKKLRHPVRMVANDALAPHVDVRLVLGSDVGSETAFLQPGAERTAVVMRD
ncbi:MAG: pilus assembly protein TadD [Burkholderiales bacterium]|nr:pilus assembly protein TadD [Burkholderiales bacterium]